MSEGKGKASEFREHQNGAFVSVLPLARGHPLSVSLPGSERDPLCLSCTTKRPKDPTLLQVSRSLQPPGTWRILSIMQRQGHFQRPAPTHGSKTRVLDKLPLHLVSSVPKKLKQSFYIVLRHKG